MIRNTRKKRKAPLSKKQLLKKYKMTECRVLLKDIRKDKTLKIVNNSVRLSSSRRKYTCYACWKIFGFKHELNAHKQAYHPEKPKDIKPKATTIPKNENQKKIVSNKPLENVDLSVPAPFKCLTCNMDFQSVDEVKMHPKSLLCRFCCVKCERNFNTVHGFLIHVLQHKISFSKDHDDKYSCSQCSEMFQDIIQLKSHNLIVHTNKIETPEPVTEASEPVSEASDPVNEPIETVGGTVDEPDKNLSVNNETAIRSEVEEEETDFTCELCFDMFSSAAELKDHMDFHKQLDGTTNGIDSNDDDDLDETILDEEPSEEPTNIVLEYDILEPDGDIPQIRYKCKKCQRTYMNLYDFNQHKTDKCILIEKCVECNENVVSNNAYIQHFLEKHSKIYICPYCFESIINRKEIEEHRLEHLKTFKNVCKICYKIFPNYQGFNKHLLEDHLQ